MFRLFLLLLLILTAMVGFGWYSSQTLPSWYEQDVPQQDKLVVELTEQINNQGVAKFLGSKFADVISGQLILSEVEFNALMISSLQASRDGRRIMAVSDAVKAQLNDGEVEVGAVIDLDKVAKTSVKAQEAVNEVRKFLPLLNESKVFLSVTGIPIARNGEVAFDNDFSVKVGSIPIASNLLRQMGMPVDEVSKLSFPLKYMSVKSIALSKGEVVLGVQSRF